MVRVITFGTFDLFHVGHLRILQRARALGDHLVVGISTDGLNMSKKGRHPVIREADRREIVASLSCVDEVFWEESLDLKEEYIRRYQADKLVMGHDWAGRFDHLGEFCKVVYLPRTDGISSTEIIDSVRLRDL
jgi:glycerol-3-phosphate cytidylyltransferase